MRSLIDPHHARISVAQQCELLGLPRSSYYYHPQGESDENLILMELLDKQYLRTPFYGVRKMRCHLLEEGYQVNPKRVRRLLRKMGIEAIYPRPRTSKPGKGHQIYPYLLREMLIDHPNQVWAADITYIPMKKGFMYLVAVIDWYSRKVLSWRLSNSMDAIMKSLSGNGSLKLGQGEVLGLDLVGMLRNLDSSYRGEGQKTVFNSIGASFTIKDGVLRNDDLSFIAPLAKALGAGDIGIGSQTLKYRVNPVVLTAADGTGGISVPVLISGTWANPKFRPDLQALIDQNLADEKAALEAKIAAEKAAAEARLQAKKAELEARLAAEKAQALQRAQEVLDVEIEEGETLEDAARRKVEEEAKRGLLNLLGGD